MKAQSWNNIKKLIFLMHILQMFPTWCFEIEAVYAAITKENPVMVPSTVLQYMWSIEAQLSVTHRWCSQLSENPVSRTDLYLLTSQVD